MPAQAGTTSSQAAGLLGHMTLQTSEPAEGCHTAAVQPDEASVLSDTAMVRPQMATLHITKTPQNP